MDSKFSARPDNALPNPGNTPEYLRPRTQSNARTRILALPAEIRENIYKFTLITNKKVTVYKGRVKFDRGLAPHALALLRTCRQIYIESRLVFYSGNNFKFPYDTFLDRYWAGKCALSREQLETIQSVVLYKSWIYFWNGRQWEFPWTACMRTFPNLKKIALQGVTLTFMLERDAVVGGSTTWVEYLEIQKGIKLEVITEDHSGPE